MKNTTTKTNNLPHKVYYDCFGSNGVAIVEDAYEHAISLRVYIRSMTTRKFFTFSEAEEAAKAHLGRIFGSRIQVPDHLPVGRVLTLSVLQNMH